MQGTQISASSMFANESIYKIRCLKTGSTIFIACACLVCQANLFGLFFKENKTHTRQSGLHDHKNFA